MAGTTFLSTPSQLSSPTAGAWTDWDVSSLISGDATGVFLRFDNGAGSSREVGARKNGSTDDYPGSQDADMVNGSIIALAAGVDGSGIVEYYIETTGVDIYLVGYTEGEATWNTNAADKSTTTTGSYVDVDISGDTTGTAIAGIFQSPGNEFRYAYVRPNGSTDNATPANDIANNTWVVGVDGSELCEQVIENVSNNLFLVGYYTADFVSNTNVLMHNITSSATWQTFTVDADAVGAFLETELAGAFSGWGARNADDSTWTTTGSPNRSGSPWQCGCNASGQVDLISGSTGRDWYERGYVTAPAATGRIMSSIAGAGGLAAGGGIAGIGGGLAG